MKIFPAVHLSELRARRERDRQAFEESTHDLRTLVHNKTRPVRFFLDHPGLLVGSIASLMAMYEVGASVLTPAPLRAINGAAGKTVGIFGRLTRLGLGIAMKAATPAVTSLIEKAWSYAASKAARKHDNNPHA